MFYILKVEAYKNMWIKLEVYFLRFILETWTLMYNYTYIVFAQ